MARYTLANDAPLYTQKGSTEFKIADSTGLLYSNNAPINYYETIAFTSGGLSASTTPPYGVTRITNGFATASEASSSLPTLTMGAPMPGVRKTITVASTAAGVCKLDVALSGATIEASSGFNFIAFSTLATAMQSVTLMGVSTDSWAVEAVNSTLLLFGAATGIRGTTIARTS
jgi:hypothetical protein